MNLGKCMMKECKTCRHEASCFKEQDYGDTRDRNKQTKKRSVHSKKKEHH